MIPIIIIIIPMILITLNFSSKNKIPPIMTNITAIALTILYPIPVLV